MWPKCEVWVQRFAMQNDRADTVTMSFLLGCLI